MTYGYFKSHTYQVPGGLGEEYAELKKATGAEIIFYDYYRNSSLYWNRLMKKLEANDTLYISHLSDLDIKRRDFIIRKRLEKLQEMKVRVFIKDTNQLFQYIDIENDSLYTIKQKLITGNLY